MSTPAEIFKKEALEAKVIFDEDQSEKNAIAYRRALKNYSTVLTREEIEEAIWIAEQEERCN